MTPETKIILGVCIFIIFIVACKMAHTYMVLKRWKKYKIDIPAPEDLK